MSPLEFLRSAVASYAPYLQSSGELHDPVFHAPTQYGTAYHMLANLVIAQQLPSEEAGPYLERGVRGFTAALNYVHDHTLPPGLASFTRDLGGYGRSNHRDFFWPAILKAWLILRELKHEKVEQFRDQIRSVDIEKSFKSRPPSNWAMVWMSGEWLRLREGLSPYSLEKFDEWLSIFFEEHILVEQGFYQEPGHPNSYDLFTRYHLSSIFVSGYDSRWRKAMDRLMRTGLQRSLDVQLSDGSVASSYRSTGQTWTLGAQIALFTDASNYFAASDPELAEAAMNGARRAFASIVRYQREGGPFSPVENCLPMTDRLGYEGYTADAHYGNLPLGFLACAIQAGFNLSKDAEIPMRPPAVRIEGDPTFRAICHRGPFSLHFNAHPAPEYDAFGLQDLTFGLHRQFHFASSARFLPNGRLYNIGMATRVPENVEVIHPICQYPMALVAPIESDGSGFLVKARPRGNPHTYTFQAKVEEDHVQVTERFSGRKGLKCLLIPYLRDAGKGTVTELEVMENGVKFRHGAEVVVFSFEAKWEPVIHLTGGFENRRGLCGMLRVNFAEPAEGISYRVWLSDQ